MAVSYTGRRDELHQKTVLPSREKTAVIYSEGQQHVTQKAELHCEGAVSYPGDGGDLHWETAVRYSGTVVSYT
jgi:predicted lipoprotein